MIDMLNQALSMGDRVVIFDFNSSKPYRGIVVGFTPQRVKVEWSYGPQWPHKYITAKVPNLVIKLLPGQS